MLLLTILLISIIITIVLMPYSRALAGKLQAVDAPNERKVHDCLMPKCGGMAMAVGTITPIVLWAPMTPFVKALLIGILVIVIFGVADDIKDLRPGVKIIGQLSAALVAVLVGGIEIHSLGGLLPAGMILPHWIAIPLTLLVIVGVTNATNLSDGLDGLAGGMALLIFLCIGYLGFCEKNLIVTMVSIAVGGAILGFLRFNSHPAALFMGDAGSQFLGFVAILLSINLTQQSTHLSSVLPLIILGIPVLDTVTVMAKRIVEGTSPFAADKSHFHHRLMAIGLFHTEAVLIIYVAQAILIIFAIVYQDASEWKLIAGYLVFAFSVVGLAHFLGKKGYHINRHSFLNPIKARLKPLKERGRLIKIFFRIVRFGVPALLLFNAFFATFQSKLFLFFAVGYLIIYILTRWLKRHMLDKVIKLGLYLMTPFLVYRCDQSIYAYLDPTLIKLYNISFLFLMISVFLTMKFTRRTNGFKSSPLDFLVVFIILLVPNLPNTAVQDFHLGLVAAKIVILFYSYEVLIGELRQKPYSLPVSTAVLMVGIKSLLFII